MTTVKDRSAREKIIRGRTNLLVSNGFFGFLAMQLRLVEDYSIPTAAVDGVSMFYNPNFIHQLDEREVEFVEAHEVMHCCFQHMTRRGNRDPFLYNIAGDYSINLDLQTAGFKLIQDRKINGKDFNVFVDAKYKGWTTEDIYEDLEKNAIKIKIKLGGGGKNGDNPDPGGCGGVMDAPGDAGKKAAAQQTWETAVRTAVAVARENNAGQIPGSLQRLVTDLQRPKVSWRDLTRRFIDQSMTKDISWSRISRRSVSIGTLMPGLVSDRLNHLIMIVDISGSINEKMMREFVSEVSGALDEGTADMVSVVYADTEVRHVDNFVQGDIVKVKTFDGGGTDFRDSFKWVTANAPNASCVIYLTDLQVTQFGDDPGCPTLWAVYTPQAHYEQLAARAPFGTPIHVSNSIG